MIIFDRDRKRKQFERASKNIAKSDFLFVESAERLVNNFGLYILKDFKTCLDLGDRNGILFSFLSKNPKIKNIVEASFIEKFLSSKKSGIIVDGEILPFEQNSFDLVISNLALHWVNDLVGCLVQIKNILRKGGFFTASIFGGRTLQELKESLAVVSSRKNIFSQRVSPFADPRDMAGLLQRAGFSEPVSFSEEIDIKYESLKDLMHDLRNMGEGNAVEKASSLYVGRDFFNEVENYYRQKFSDEEGFLNAKFEIITFSGWRLK